MYRELEFATEPNPSRLRPLSSLTRPRQDQVPFELSQPAQDRQHQPSVRRGRVGPRIAERPEVSTSLADLGHDFTSTRPRLTAAINLYVDFNWVDHSVLRLSCIGFRGIQCRLQFSKIHILAND